MKKTRKTQRFILLLLSAIMLFCVSAQAAEESGTEMENMIISAKEQIQIDEDIYELDTYSMDNYSNRKIYNLEWKNKENGEDRIYVSIRSDGVIESYSTYSTYSEAGKFLKYQKSDAQAAARDFLSRAAKNDIDKLREPEIQKSGSGYQVIFGRQENGIPVSDCLSVYVDGNTLKIESFYRSWNDETEFRGSDKIGRSKAEEVYKNELGYDLYYLTKSKNYEVKSKLVYAPKNSGGFFVDAETGKAASYNTYYSEPTMEMAADAESKSMGGGRSLSPSEAAAVKNISNMISEKEADSIARSFTEFNINDSYSLESTNLYRDSNGTYSYNLEYTKKDDENWGFKSVAIDAVSGELKRYYGYKNTYGKEKTLGYDEGKKISEDFIKKYFPQKYETLTFNETIGQIPGRYDFLRTENGIKVANNGFFIGIDDVTKEISSVTIELPETDFPAPDGKIELPFIYDKVLSEENFGLEYIIIYGEKNQNESKLVYRAKKEKIYDAFTGEALSSYSLEPETVYEKPQYTDISGHYCEPYVNKLLEADVFLEGSELRPDETITKKDFVTLCYMVLYGERGDTNYALFEYAKSISYFKRLIKDDADENEPLTRMEAIETILDKMGYGEFVKIEGIFKCPFGDVPEEKIGAAAVASGLKLANGDNGMLYPDAPLKRGDALIMMYNYMAR